MVISLRKGLILFETFQIHPFKVEPSNVEERGREREA